MGKLHEIPEDIPLEVALTPQMSKALDQLVKTGLFGLTRAQVAERLLCDRIIDLIDDDWVRL